ncbi:hypothetical protein FPZ12_040770 [Amycolatopsis acidicola]|uniref:Uncharacterized protein n=1 Tax=Amycolatopsis acidicola TaxID=2596893 RepID=A0A5N0UQ93_9PSEU|nr:hypothetical protein [Amycolatopsis acidicola]KAA9150642.1 hypothetical protein FPZ12_040770 [Amycolatopsis acidicola]
MLVPGGVFVLTYLHAVGFLRLVFALGGRRARMHTKPELAGMLREAALEITGWASVFDLDPLLPLRVRRARPPNRRVPLVTAVIARRP